MNINWGLQDPNSYQRGYDFSTGVVDDAVKRVKQNALEAAMRGYATNPDDPNALNALIQADPATGMQVRQQQAQQQAQGAEQYQGTIKTAAEMIRNMKAQNPNAPDEQIYATVRQTLIANRAPGADQSPEQFDPQYFQGLLSMADGPKAAESPYQAVAGQPGAGVYRFDKRTGTMQVLVQPNDGTQPMGAPVPDSMAAIPSVSNSADYDAIPAGQQYRDPSGNVRVKPGGPTATPSGGFSGYLGSDLDH